jgi:hypothetical protein
MSPRLSAKRQSVALGMSSHSVRRILHKDLNIYLNEILVVQELSDCDMANCSMVAERLIRILSNNIICLMTDEAHLHLSGYQQTEFLLLGRGNYMQWLHQWPLHSACVTVWCRVANFRVLGP